MSNPAHPVARIDPARCIGCTKCQQACPSDAILGAAKIRHHIVQSLCNGCGNCLDTCPTTCISWVSGTGRPVAAAGRRASAAVPQAAQPALPELPPEIAAMANAARHKMHDKYTTRTQPVPPKMLRNKS